MKTHARVVVIGGGIAGCSTLYHLTQAGWSDVVLLERDELTSGTTWHSAAQVTNFGAVQTMVGLKSHSIKLYAELAGDPDYPINYHQHCGGIRLAGTSDHIDGYHHFVSLAKGMGVDFEVIDALECAKRHPLLETNGLLGGLWDPLDGDIDPAQLCQALARRARIAGAEIYRHTPVVGIHQSDNGEWVVETQTGSIVCEKVVNAGGYRVNEVGAMMGVAHPVVSMEHQYFLTEAIAELEARDERVPLLRDPIDDFYTRQEKHGLLVGIYEQDCKTWGMDGIDPNFTSALCPNDLDRCLPNMERVFERLPCLTQIGIHTIINGPITYTADGLPLVGKIPGLTDAYCIVGLRAGLGEGGGHGKILADIIVHGESEWDTWCLDPRRFGSYANLSYTAAKAVEDYQNEFRFHMPHEYRPAARCARTSPLYAHLKSRGAHFSVVNGWERVAYFQPSDEFEEHLSFRFSNVHEVVGREVAAVQAGVGLMEVSGFNRYEFRGPDVQDWLRTVSCSRLPKRVGQLRLVYGLNEHGNVLLEATIARIDEDRWWYGSAAAAEHHDWDHLMLSKPDSVDMMSLTSTHTTLVIAGPKSRALLANAAPRTNWSPQAFPWMTTQCVVVGHASAIAMCVSYSGEQAFELHVPNEQLLACYEAICEAGEPVGLETFGGYAAESMRMEKGYRHWKADLITEFNMIESGLERFVDASRSDFIGHAALVENKDVQPRRLFVSLCLDGDVAPAHSGDSIMSNGQVVGTITSAAWGHRVGRNLAMGFIEPEHGEVGHPVSVLVLGTEVPAEVCESSLYDSLLKRVRT